MVFKKECVYFDNFFSSFSLFAFLNEQNYKFACTMQSNRIPEYPLMPDKSLKTKDRGFFDSAFDTESKVFIAKWHDNAVVHVSSNFVGSEPISTVSRRSKGSRRDVEMPPPYKIV